LVKGGHLLFQLAPALGTEANPCDHDDLGTMSEAVESCGGQERITKEIGPFFGRTIAGQDNAAALITFINNIIQILRCRRAQWFEAKVVKDEKVWAQIGLQSTLITAVCAAAMDVLQHLVRIDEQDIETLAASLVG
jgi:hypothetical protein